MIQPPPPYKPAKRAMPTVPASAPALQRKGSPFATASRPPQAKVALALTRPSGAAIAPLPTTHRAVYAPAIIGRQAAGRLDAALPKPVSAKSTRSWPPSLLQNKRAAATPQAGAAPTHTLAPPAIQRRGIQVTGPAVRLVQRAAQSTHVVTGTTNFRATRGAALGDYGYRQLRMRTVSTGLRNAMALRGGGVRRAVNIFHITLLHGWNITDPKTAQRITALNTSPDAVAASNTALTPLTAATIDNIMPSTEEIQIVERNNLPGNYVTLQGVGRLVALRQWLHSRQVTTDFFVEVMTYPPSGAGADSLVNISETYDEDESSVSRNVLGPAIYAAGTIAAAGAALFSLWAGAKRYRGG